MYLLRNRSLFSQSSEQLLSIYIYLSIYLDVCADIPGPADGQSGGHEAEPGPERRRAVRGSGGRTGSPGT